MNKKILNAGMLLLATAMFWSCSNESIDGPGPGPDSGELKKVTLAIESGKSDKPTTKASHTEDERTFDEKNLRLFVYDSNGRLEIDQALSLDSKSQAIINVKAGDKYFYVFANSNNQTPFTAQPLRTEFERQIIDVLFEDSNSPTNLTKDRALFMGTLWAGTVKIDSNRDENELLTLKIGRSAAKVKLHTVNKNKPGYTIRKGEFIEPNYKMGGVAKKSYLVGQYTGDMPPANYTSVTSAVHSAAALKENGDPNTDDFMVYTTFKPVTDMSSTGSNENAFYVTENTTKVDNLNQQYYGNTTYIRLRTKYVPTADEVYTDDLKPANRVLSNPTFWTIIKDGKFYICEQEPNNNHKPDDGIIRKYTNGYNYHSIVIRDKNKDTEEKRNATLRNHYYEVEVTGIRDIGDHEEEEEWEKPIPVNVNVLATIQVEDWSTITQGEDI